MLNINDALVVIAGGGIDCAVAGHWVKNGDKKVLIDIAKEVLL